MKCGKIKSGCPNLVAFSATGWENAKLARSPLLQLTSAAGTKYESPERQCREEKQNDPASPAGTAHAEGPLLFLDSAIRTLLLSIKLIHRACPTLRRFRSVGTTGLDSMSIRHRS